MQTFSKNEHEKRRNEVFKRSCEHARNYGFYDPIIAGSIDGTDEQPHDTAILRALNSRYKPNFAKFKRDNGDVGEPEKTLFIGRIGFQTDEKTIEQHFAKYGRIKSLRVVRDLVTGFPKGYAFVEFKHRADAKAAYRSSYKLQIDNMEVIVEYELERVLKGWKPRRLGGGEMIEIFVLRLIKFLIFFDRSRWLQKKWPAQIWWSV